MKYSYIYIALLPLPVESIGRPHISLNDRVSHVYNAWALSTRLDKSFTFYVGFRTDPYTQIIPSQTTTAVNHNCLFKSLNVAVPQRLRRETRLNSCICSAMNIEYGIRGITMRYDSTRNKASCCRDYDANISSVGSRGLSTRVLVTLPYVAMNEYT